MFEDDEHPSYSRHPSRDASFDNMSESAAELELSRRSSVSRHRVASRVRMASMTHDLSDEDDGGDDDLMGSGAPVTRLQTFQRVTGAELLADDAEERIAHRLSRVEAHKEQRKELHKQRLDRVRVESASVALQRYAERRESYGRSKELNLRAMYLANAKAYQQAAPGVGGDDAASGQAVVIEEEEEEELEREEEEEDVVSTNGKGDVLGRPSSANQQPQLRTAPSVSVSSVGTPSSVGSVMFQHQKQYTEHQRQRCCLLATTITADSGGPSLLWSLLRMLLTFFYLFAAPYRVAFIGDEFDETLAIAYAVDAFFVVDLALRLFWYYDLDTRFSDAIYEELDEVTHAHAHDDDDGKPRRAAATDVSWHTVYRSYRRSRMFWVSVVGVVPLDLLFISTSWKVVHFVRLTRLLHGFTLSRTAKELPIKCVSDHAAEIINRIVALLLRIIIFAHIFACLFHMISRHLEDRGQTTWLRCSPSDYYGTGTGGVGSGLCVEQESTARQYQLSLYWAFTTLSSVGYGDITPTQSLEVSLSMVVMLFGWITYGMVIGALVPIVGDRDYHEFQHDEKIRTLKDFMGSRATPKDVQRRIENYYELLYDRQLGDNENHLLHRQLPDAFRNEICVYMLTDSATDRSFLRNIPYFESASVGFLRGLAASARMEYYFPRDIILFRGQISHRLFVILRGHVDWLDESHTIVLGCYHKGDSFGHNMFAPPTDALRRRIRVAGTHIARSFVDVATISHRALLEQVELYQFQSWILDVRDGLRRAHADFADALDDPQHFQPCMPDSDVHLRGKRKPKHIAGSDSVNEDVELTSLGRSDDHTAPKGVVDTSVADDGYDETMEEDTLEVEYEGVYLPESRFRQVWNFLSLVGVIYYGMIIPWRLAFWRSSWTEIEDIDWVWLTIDWVVDAFFVVDIYMRLRYFAHENPVAKDEPIVDPNTFMHLYLRTSFPWDVLAALPLELIPLLGITGRRNEILLYLRLNRLLRLKHARIYFERFVDFVNTRRKDKLAARQQRALAVFVVPALLMFHMVACMWFFISDLQDDDEQTWILRDGVLDSARKAKYFRSYHWSLLTSATVGYGGIVPVQTAEVNFALLAIVSLTLFYYLVVASRTHRTEAENRSEHEFFQHATLTAEFIRNRVTKGRDQERKALSERIHGYNRFLWNFQRGLAEEQALSSLPEHLRFQLVYALAEPVFKSLPVFSAIPEKLHTPGLFYHIALAFRSRVFPPNEVIHHDDRLYNRRLYLITGGEVVVHYTTRAEREEIIEQAELIAEVDDTNSNAAALVEEQRIQKESPDAVNRSDSGKLHRLATKVHATDMSSPHFDEEDGPAVPVEPIDGHQQRIARPGFFFAQEHLHPTRDKVDAHAYGGRISIVGGEDAAADASDAELETDDDEEQSELPLHQVPSMHYHRTFLAAHTTACNVLTLSRAHYHRVLRKYNVSLSTLAARMAEQEVRPEEQAESPPASPVLDRELSGSGGSDGRVQLHGDKKDKPARRRRDEEDEAKPIAPDDRVRIYWELVKIAFMFYFTVMVPFRIAFFQGDDDTAMRAWLTLSIDAVIDIFLIFDIYLRRTRFEETVHGSVQTPQEMWEKHGYKYYIWLDVAASCPLDMLALLSGRRLLYWLRLTRMIRLYRMSDYIRTFSDLIELHSLRIRPATLRIVSRVFILFIFAHWAACVWYVIGVWESPTATRSWLFMPADPDDAPPIMRNFDDQYVAFKYVRALYFCIITISTVGYGDIKPQTVNESIFGICLMLVGCVLYALVTASIASLIATTDGALTEHQGRMDQLKAYMNKHFVSNELKKRIMRYLRSLWKTGKGVNETRLLQYLPTSIRYDAYHLMYGSVLGRLPLLKGVDSYTMRALSARLERRFFAQDETIRGLGESVHNLTVLYSGKVLLRHRSTTGVGIKRDSGVDEQQDPAAPQADANSSSPFYFGSSQLLQDTPSLSDIEVTAVTPCVTLTLYNGHLYRLYQSHPELKQLMLRNSDASDELEKAVIETAQNSRETSRARVDTDSVRDANRRNSGSFLDVEMTTRVWGYGLTRRIEWDFKLFMALVVYLLLVPAQIIFVYSAPDTTFWSLYSISLLTDIVFWMDLYKRMRVFEPETWHRTPDDAVTEQGLSVVVPGALDPTQVPTRRASKLVQSMARVEGMERPTLEKMSRGDVWRQYWHSNNRTRRLLELLALFPFDLVVLFFAFSSSQHRTIVFVRLNRILLLLRLGSYLENFDRWLDAKENFDFQYRRMWSLALWILIAAHWIACFWYLIGQSDDSSWFDAFTESKLEGNDDIGTLTRYIYSLYWSLTTITTTGYGDIAPVNSREVLFTLLAILVGDLLAAAVIGLISIRTANQRSTASEVERMRAVLTRYMEDRRLETRLRTRILSHFQQLSEREVNLNERALVRDLPDYLHKSLATEEHFVLLKDVPFFKDCDRHFLSRLASYLEPQYFLEDSVIVRAGEVTSKLFFVSYGDVSVFVPRNIDDAVIDANAAKFDNKSDEEVHGYLKSEEGRDLFLELPLESGHMRELPSSSMLSRSFFGEASFFLGDVSPSYVVTNSWSIIWSLKHSRFRRLLHMHPNAVRPVFDKFLAFQSKLGYEVLSGDAGRRIEEVWGVQ